MGTRQSKIKSPYDILQVTPFHSLSQIKSSYLTLFRSNKSSDYNVAYQTILDSPPPLHLYSDLTDDIIDKINQFAKTSVPKMNENREMCKSLSKLRVKYFKNDKEKNEFYYHLNRLLKKHKSLNNDVSTSNVCVNTNIISKFCGPLLKCRDCNKDFKSLNTLRDHYNSKKHKEKSKESHIFLVEEIRHEVVVEIKTEKKETETSVPVEKPSSDYKLDHLVFRTCHHCKGEFKTRTELLQHLRSKHNRN
ncbi:DnaJ-like protein [Vairimorpha necatrix]|uniref:DnaJ-like protein n=1 Tax=Vairimorpha necatrix TaxID=6039 RepID=A0AAX4JHS2_9MICR